MGKSSKWISLSISPTRAVYKKMEKLNYPDTLEAFFSTICEDYVFSKECGKKSKIPTHYQIGLLLKKSTRSDSIRTSVLRLLPFQLDTNSLRHTIESRVHNNIDLLFCYCLKETPAFYSIKSINHVMNKEYFHDFVMQHDDYYKLFSPKKLKSNENINIAVRHFTKKITGYDSN